MYHLCASNSVHYFDFALGFSLASAALCWASENKLPIQMTNQEKKKQ